MSPSLDYILKIRAAGHYTQREKKRNSAKVSSSARKAIISVNSHEVKIELSNSTPLQ